MCSKNQNAVETHQLTHSLNKRSGGESLNLLYLPYSDLLHPNSS